jgi:hypothetical protein
MPEATADDWAKQNKLRQEWLANNPDADYNMTTRCVTCGFNNGFDSTC